jgi:hypothetical protein
MLIMGVIRMPSKKAKDRKRKRATLNKKWATEGRTASQHKKWLAKERGNQPSNPYLRK